MKLCDIYVLFQGVNPYLVLKRSHCDVFWVNYEVADMFRAMLSLHYCSILKSLLMISSLLHV